MSAVAERYRYRTFWRRVSAAVIDALVLWPLMWILAPDTYHAEAPVAILSLTALGYGVSTLYSVLMHARYGQTLGKMARGVKVMNVEETRSPTLREALLRDIGEIVLDFVALAYLVFALTSSDYVPGKEYESTAWDVLAWTSFGWALLEIVTMLTNPKRRAIHDFIAGTVVVRIPPR